MSVSSKEIRSARAQALVQLTVPDIDRVHEPGTAREQHVGKTAGRSADVEANASVNVDPRLLERCRELDAAARDPRMCRLACRAASTRISVDGLVMTTASAVTSPAAIAACACARLANNPRSTSS